MTEDQTEDQLLEQRAQLDAYQEASEALERVLRFAEDKCACGAIEISPADKPQTLDGVVHDYWVCHHEDEGP